MMAILSAALERPWALPLLLLLPALVAWAVLAGQRRRRTRLARLGNDAIVSRLVPPDVVRGAGPRALRLGLAALFGAAAFVGPRWGRETTMVETEGVDIVLSLDASASMLATDEKPSRLDRMKQEVRRLRAAGTGDRIALAAFAGRSYILTPLTVDAGALDLFLDNLDPTVVGQAGTSLASTLRQGRELLGATKSASDRALVVMTDGETWDEPEEVMTEARQLRESGLAVVLVGFGTTQGTTIPLRESNGRSTLKRDAGGAIVVTRYNPELLKAAAEAAGGTFIPAEATDKAARVRQALRGLRTQRRQAEAGNARTARFQLFLIPAVLLLLLDTLLQERGARRRRSAAAATPASPDEAAAAAPAEPEAPTRSLRGRPAARASALVLLSLLTGGTPSVARADDASDAAREMRAGRTQQAIALYRRAIANGDTRPSTLYNLGTALLAADSLAAATDALERAAKAPGGEIRYRAHYNLGLAQLRRGLAAGDSADQYLGAAVETYKKALLIRPTDRDAKWNYELALRKKQGGGGGGGQQQQDPAQNDPGEDREAPTPRPAGGIGREQAEQILNSAARDERDVQGKRQRRNRPQPPPGGKDW